LIGFLSQEALGAVEKKKAKAVSRGHPQTREALRSASAHYLEKRKGLEKFAAKIKSFRRGGSAVTGEGGATLLMLQRGKWNEKKSRAERSFNYQGGWGGKKCREV